MARRFPLFALLAALAAAPLVTAHTPAGTPNPACGDGYVHEYGPGSAFPVWAPAFLAARDGSNGCDGHREYAGSGVILLAGLKSLTCWSEPADHPQFPTITVADVVHPSPTFVIGVDTGPAPCGDFEDDVSILCVGTCTVPFAPGIDGAYHVYVLDGTVGHVST